MDKKQTNSLTSYEITFTLVGIAIGVYILSAAGDVTKDAQQDGWISMMLGSIYPLYVVLIGGYIIKNHTKDNILTLSKKYLGAILGNILNFIFLLQFIFYLTFMTATIITLLRTYQITLLSPIKTVFVTLSIAAYAASRGIKTIAKINVVVFYFIVLLVTSSFAALKYGSFLNIMPVGSSGITNIFKSASESVQSYFAIEILLLIHPFAQESKSIKTAALKAVLLVSIIYAWIVFITIYFLGIEVIPLSFWPSIMVFNSIHLPLINNFITIFMFLWTFIFLKSMANQYFIISFILKDFINISIKKICLIMFPPVIYLSLLFSREPKFSEYFNASAVYILVFNISYITIIALLIFSKQKRIKNSMKGVNKKTL